jgi:hypothetical protein
MEDPKSWFRRFVVESGRIDERGQTPQEWEEEVEEEARFEAEQNQDLDWNELSDN